MCAHAHAGIAKAVAKAAGKEVKIVHYDPSQMGLKKGEGFPFRREPAWLHGHLPSSCPWFRSLPTQPPPSSHPTPPQQHATYPSPPGPLACRTVHFFASAEKAKRVLGWKPEHDFMSDVEGLVADFKASGRLDKEVDFSVDDKILAQASVCHTCT
jgi:hypothetical protein